MYDSAISSSYNNLSFLVRCLRVKNNPFVFGSYFISLKLVILVFSVPYTGFVLRTLLFDNLKLRIQEIYVDFKLLSLNVRGIMQSPTKRKALFCWLGE